MPTNQVYSIAICDNSVHDLDKIVQMTQVFFQQKQINYNIHTYTKSLDLLSAIEQNMEFHLLLLDVMMEHLNGIELAARLRKMDKDMSIVFISGNREMAMQGYEVAASRYLAKPVNDEKFFEALAFCYQNYLQSCNILFPTSKGIRSISPTEILYAEAGNRGITIFLQNEQLQTNMRMFELEEILSHQSFFLCHRAFLVNFAHVKYIRCYEIELENGELVPVSKHRYAEAKQKLLQYLKT